MSGFDDAVAFWEQVGERAPIESLEVGDVFAIEDHSVEPHGKRLVKLVRKWQADDGTTKIEIADTAVGEPQFILIARRASDR